MGVPPSKLHEKPAEANKSGTEGEQKAGFFDPVAASGAAESSAAGGLQEQDGWAALAGASLVAELRQAGRGNPKRV